MPLDLRPRGNAGKPGELCELHGGLCKMGSNWPAAGPEIELYCLIRNAKISTGQPVEEPDPFTINKHRPMGKSQRRELEQLLTEAKAKVAAEEQAIINGETI